MTDIVERLGANMNPLTRELDLEAAEEIKRLQKKCDYLGITYTQAQAEIERWTKQSIAQYAEIERLRANERPFVDTIKQLTADVERLQSDYSILKRDYDAQRAEIERLYEENMFFRGLVADRLEALNPAKNKRI